VPRRVCADWDDIQQKKNRNTEGKHADDVPKTYYHDLQADSRSIFLRFRS
jgi:hypothetical protein